MHTRELLERLGNIIMEINLLYAEIDSDLPQLRITVDNTHGHSELKKIPLRKFYISQGF